jgi:hypothetical protein
MWAFSDTLPARSIRRAQPSKNILSDLCPIHRAIDLCDKNVPLWRALASEGGPLH